MKRFFSQIFQRFFTLPNRKKVIGFSLLVLLTFSLLSSPEEEMENTALSPSQSSSRVKDQFPKIDGGSDGILEKILRPFYEDNVSARWWARVEKVVEGAIGNETAKMIYIKTDYRLDNVDDVEAATLLCNALIRHLPREGLSVRVDGLIEKGRTLLDGSIETKVLEDPVTDFGSSSNRDDTPNWCVARTLFYDVRDGLKARGWKQQYGYGSLTPQEKERMYQGAFMQKGKIWFVN